MMTNDCTAVLTQMRIGLLTWWGEWWNASSVELGPANAVLQHWYYTMMYLLRSSARADTVAPALWGPFSVTDAPDWGALVP